MNKNSLEEQLKKLEEKLNLEPSCQTWSKIESQLPKRKDKKRLFYRMIWLQTAAAMILVFGLCIIAYFMHKNRNEKIQLANRMEPVSAIPEVVQAPFLETESKIAAKEQADIQAKEKVVAEHKPKRIIETGSTSSESPIMSTREDKAILPGHSASSDYKLSNDSKPTLLWPSTIRSPYYGKYNGVNCYASIKSTAVNSLWTINKSASDKVDAKLVFQKEAAAVLLVANFDGRVYVFDVKSVSNGKWIGQVKDDTSIVLNIEQIDDKIRVELKDQLRSIYHQLTLQPTYE